MTMTYISDTVRGIATIPMSNGDSAAVAVTATEAILSIQDHRTVVGDVEIKGELAALDGLIGALIAARDVLAGHDEHEVTL